MCGSKNWFGLPRDGNFFPLLLEAARAVQKISSCQKWENVEEKKEDWKRKRREGDLLPRDLRCSLIWRRRRKRTKERKKERKGLFDDGARSTFMLLLFSPFKENLTYAAAAADV
jgi:hypothetical protein